MKKTKTIQNQNQILQQELEHSETDLGDTDEHTNQN